MKDSPFDNALLASLRALEDVIFPALDPAQPLANEQLQLVCKFLKFMRQRVGYSGDLARAGLDVARSLALGLLPHIGDAPPELREGLGGAIARANRLLSLADAQDGELHAAAHQLDTLNSCITRYAVELPQASREAIERAVLTQSRAVLDIQRAWFSPLGLDFEPSSIPAIDAAMRGH